MAQVNQSAWNQGSLMYRDSMDRERQARMDAMAEERLGYERDDRARLQKARDETRDIAMREREAMQGAEAAPAGPMFGNSAVQAQPPMAEQPAVAANPTVNNAVTSEAANPVTNNLAGGLKAGMNQMASQQRRLMAFYDMAMANNDRQGMQQASAAMQSLNTASQRANIFNSVLSNPDSMAQIAANLTDNPNIALKANVDPKTGITTLVRDDGQKIKMSPAQMAMTAVHMWDMQNGDPNAMDKIAGINKELGQALKDANSMQATMAKSANDAVKLGADVDQTRAHTAYYNAAAARQQAVADNGGSTSKGSSADRLWELSGRDDVLATYGGDRQRAYASLKRGDRIKGVEEQANAIRQKLLEKGDVSAADAEAKVGAFLHANGVAPQAAIQALRSGKRPDGKPLTAQDVNDWNRTYPNMPAEDVLGGSPAPTPEQVELMRADAAKNGIANPQFNWQRGGLNLSGALNPQQGGDTLPARMAPRQAANSADGRVAQAQETLRRFGLRQRRDDPQGYAAAQQEYDAAVAERNQARTATPEEMQRATRPYFGRSAP